MTKSSLILTIFLGLFFLTLYSYSSTHTSNSKYFQIDTSQYAIIKFDKTQTWLFKNAKPSNLTISEIDAIEIILKQAVQEYNKDIKNEKFAIRPLTNYKRQYVPVINNKGQKEVYVNCFCSTWDDRWKKEFMLVEDGGNCYFNVKINLTTKTYYQLAVNGYA